MATSRRLHLLTSSYPAMLALRVFGYVLLSYQFLYYVYKWHTPRPGFVPYALMYENPIGSGAGAPFEYRFLSSLPGHLILRMGIHYDTTTTYQADDYHKRLFFAALISNYLALLVAAIVTSMIIDEIMHRKSHLAAFVAGVACILSFGVLTSVMSGFSDGWGWVAFGAAYLALIKKSRWMLVMVCAASIFLREIVPLLLILWAVIDYSVKKEDKGFFRFVLGTGIVTSLAYFVIRTKFWVIAGYESQLDAERVVSSLMDFFALRHSPEFYGDILTQGYLTQNLMLGYLLICLVGYALGVPSRREQLVTVIASSILLLLLGMATEIGNNLGRIQSMLSPVLAAFCVVSLWDLRVASKVDSVKAVASAEGQA